jgi:UTP--glucose-1-phosphate uridylyltransferase
VEEICLVVCLATAHYASGGQKLVQTPRFVVQPAPLGYGTPSVARAPCADDPFLHLVSDHLYVSREKQLRAAVSRNGGREDCAVSAVQATREGLLPYGAVGGKGVPNRSPCMSSKVMETYPTEAEQNLIVPGLRAGHYLCFFGMHVLTPALMEVLSETADPASAMLNLSLAAALVRLAERERYLALQISGRRYNIGVKFGLLNAQLALALDGQDREGACAIARTRGAAPLRCANNSEI